MPKDTATYRERIQDLIARIDEIYEEAEYLRDCASEDEKKHWNDHRRIFYDAAKPMRNLDNQLSDHRANMKVNAKSRNKRR